MEKLEIIKKELIRLQSNQKKSSNRQYTEKTKQEKLNTIEKLLEEAKDVINPVTTVEAALDLRVEYSIISSIAAELKKSLQSTKMVFDIRTATSLVQHYNGNHDDTEVFLESIDLLDELTPEDQKTTMVKFIKTRITGKAKYAITEDITTIALIKEKIKSKFSTRLSTDALLAQLRSCRQGGKKITDFANQIEDLSRQLTRALISEGVASGESAEKLAEKFSIQAFTENLANPETSLILKASNLSTISQTAAKAITVDKPQSTVLHLATNRGIAWTNRGNHQGNNNNRHNNGNRNQRRGRYQYQNTGRYPANVQFHRNQPQQRSNNNYNDRRYQPGLNNGGSRQQNRNFPNRRINYCESGEEANPQLNTETHRLGENIEYEQ